MKSARISEASRCSRCLVRWKQSKLGLCRRCERELGIEAEGVKEREAERVEKRHAREAMESARYKVTPSLNGRTPHALDRTPRGGQPWLDYVVVWDGSFDGAAAMGRPMAHEKGIRGDGHSPDGVAGSLLRLRGQRTGPALRRPGAFERD